MVETFLKAGAALSKIELFCNLLERNSTQLSSRSSLSRMIPMILAEERDNMKTAILDRSVSVIKNGCTRLREALVIVLQYVDNRWLTKQVLVRLKVL